MRIGFFVMMLLASVASADDLKEIADALGTRGDKVCVRVTKPDDLIKLFIQDVISGNVKLPKDSQGFIKDKKLYLQPVKGDPVEVDRTLFFFVVENMMGGKWMDGEAFVPMPLYARYAATLNAVLRKNVRPEKIKVHPTDK